MENTILPTDSKINDYGASCSTYLKVYKDCTQPSNGCFDMSPSSATNYQPGSSSIRLSKRQDNPCFNARSIAYNNDDQVSFYKKFAFPPKLQTARVERKRTFKQTEIGSTNLTKVDFGKLAENKKDFCCQDQLDFTTYNQVKEVAGKRSQKLSDKITTLQKLVSPYGKTDTASVLHEACISIKILQDQIQKSYRALSDSNTNTRLVNSQSFEEKHHTFRSKGLCLVPFSSIK